MELSIMCNADVALFAFDEKKQLHIYSNKPHNEIVQRVYAFQGEFKVMDNSHLGQLVSGRASSHLVCDTHRKNSGENSTCVERYPTPTAVSSPTSDHHMQAAPPASSASASSASSQSFTSASASASQSGAGVGVAVAREVSGPVCNLHPASGPAHHEAFPSAHPKSAQVMRYDASSPTAPMSGQGTSSMGADAKSRNFFPPAQGSQSLDQQEMTVNLSGDGAATGTGQRTRMSGAGAGGLQSSGTAPASASTDTDLPALDGDMSPGPIPRFNGVDMTSSSSGSVDTGTDNCAPSRKRPRSPSLSGGALSPMFRPSDSALKVRKTVNSALQSALALISGRYSTNAHLLHEATRGCGSPTGNGKTTVVEDIDLRDESDPQEEKRPAASYRSLSFVQQEEKRPQPPPMPMGIDPSAYAELRAILHSNAAAAAASAAAATAASGSASRSTPLSALQVNAMTTLPPHMLAQPPPDTPPGCTPPPTLTNGAYFASHFAANGGGNYAKIMPSFRPVYPPTPLPESEDLAGVTQYAAGTQNGRDGSQVRTNGSVGNHEPPAAAVESQQHTSAFKPTTPIGNGGFGHQQQKAKLSQFRPSSAPINPSVRFSRYVPHGAAAGGGYAPGAKRDVKFLPNMSGAAQQRHQKPPQDAGGHTQAAAAVGTNLGFGGLKRQPNPHRGKIYAPTPQVPAMEHFAMETDEASSWRANTPLPPPHDALLRSSPQNPIAPRALASSPGGLSTGAAAAPGARMRAAAAALVSSPHTGHRTPGIDQSRQYPFVAQTPAGSVGGAGASSSPAAAGGAKPDASIVAPASNAPPAQMQESDITGGGRSSPAADTCGSQSDAPPAAAAARDGTRRGELAALRIQTNFPDGNASGNFHPAIGPLPPTPVAGSPFGEDHVLTETFG